MAQVATPAARPTKGGGGGQQLKSFFTYQPGKVKPDIIVQFCKQLSSFVRVGVPVTTAIETFAEQAPNQRLRDTYLTVASDIQRGIRLSDAFAAHPRVFPRIIADMVRSAEQTGSLDVVLRQAAKHIEREASARRKIRGAMTYPVIILSIAIVIAVAIVVLLLPNFRRLYDELHVPIPGIMSTLLGLSAFLSAHGVWIIVGVLAAVIVLAVWRQTESGRYVLDSVLLKIPVIAALLRASMTERFCRTFGDMLAAGVPISQTYSVVIDNVSNRVYKRGLASVGPGLAAGHGIYRPLAASRVFPPTVLQMIRVGEETGHLDVNLTETADLYEDEIDYRIKRMTAVLEPALIVFVGLIVGFVAVILISSIYSLAGGFK